MSRLDSLLGFLREDPNDTFTLFAIASEFRKLGDDEQALAYFNRLAEHHPDYVGTYYHLGKLLESLHRAEEAIAVYTRGIRKAEELRDFHARAELQDALMRARGVDFDDNP
ncbi:MAG: tetratricopeptide repeat protein [Rhodothermales bacterium]